MALEYLKNLGVSWSIYVHILNWRGVAERSDHILRMLDVPFGNGMA